LVSDCLSWGTHWRAGNLDGILLGTASAVSFTLVETLGQYVPEMIRNGSLEAGAVSVGELVGLQLLFPQF